MSFFYCRKPGMTNLSVKRQQSMVSAPTQIAEYPKTPLGEKWYMFTQWVATYSLQIFWLTLYSLVLMGIFIERAVCKYEPWDDLKVQSNLSYVTF